MAKSVIQALLIGLCRSLIPPEGISQSPCCLCNRRRVRSVRLPPFELVISPGRNGKTSLCQPASRRCAIRAETSVWLCSTSKLQLELLLADSNGILSSPLFFCPLAPPGSRRATVWRRGEQQIRNASLEPAV